MVHCTSAPPLMNRPWLIHTICFILGILSIGVILAAHVGRFRGCFNPNWVQGFVPSILNLFYIITITIIINLSFQKMLKIVDAKGRFTIHGCLCLGVECHILDNLTRYAKNANKYFPYQLIQPFCDYTFDPTLREIIFSRTNFCEEIFKRSF